VAISAPAQKPDSARVMPQSAGIELALGKRAFDINCARCHGIGGTGNTGPSLVRAVLPRARSDTAFRAVIQDGIPDTEMPNSFWVSDVDVTRIIAYVRSLGNAGDALLTGNAVRGQAVYARSACATCHIIEGVGGVVGPELSDIGARRSAVYLRRSVLEPAADFPQERGYQLYGVVRAVERDGKTVTGVRVNEDTYTIQLRDADGHFHSLRKDQLRSLERRFGTSLMPSVRGTLTDAAVDDLVAYLASLNGRNGR
jgi:putative heme-binding domain-containing protein